jgi:DNA-binding NtrC family response regulator
MRRHDTNISAAAREAQIDRKHLRELLAKHGIAETSPASPDERGPKR